MRQKTLPTYGKSSRAFERLTAENLAPAIQAQEERRDAVKETLALKFQAAVIPLEAMIAAADQRKMSANCKQEMYGRRPSMRGIWWRK
jgi:hypothetical protein